MKLTTISDVSKLYDVTTRTLRYYEEIGLISSKRKEDYAYRVYDKEAISRLQIILMLRKLSISLKDIQIILSSNSPDQFIKLLKKRLDDVDQEIDSLNNVKEIVQLFLQHVSEYQKLEYDIHALDVLVMHLLLKNFNQTPLILKC